MRFLGQGYLEIGLCTLYCSVTIYEWLLIMCIRFIQIYILTLARTHRYTYTICTYAHPYLHTHLRPHLYINESEWGLCMKLFRTLCSAWWKHSRPGERFMSLVGFLLNENLKPIRTFDWFRKNAFVCLYHLSRNSSNFPAARRFILERSE